MYDIRTKPWSISDTSKKIVKSRFRINTFKPSPMSGIVKFDATCISISLSVFKLRSKLIFKVI